MPFSVRKLTSRIGAVVDGVDFTASPDLLRILQSYVVRPEDGRRSEQQLVGDASHYARALELVG
jgi:hypothetical protein